MKTRHRYGKSIAILALFCIGCHPPAVNVSEAHLCDPRAQILQLEHLYKDNSLAQEIGIVRTTRARNESGLLRIQTLLENYTKNRIAINYMVEWTDQDEMIIETASGGWKQLIFEPYENHTLVFTAPSPVAQGFRIKMARPK